MNGRFDIIIVGGGMAGASLAIALSGQGLRLALVEAAPLKVKQVPNYDARGVALALGSRRILDTLGVWPLLAGQAQPIERIHVSEQGGFGVTRLSAEEQQVPALGYVISAQDLGRGLLCRLEDCADVSVFAPQRLQWVSVEPEQLRAGLGEQEIQAALIVAADGGDSFVRRQLGLQVAQSDYHQSAVTANLMPQKPHGNVAWERFTAHGPMALLPMTEGRCALVWTVPNAQLGRVLALDDEQFLSQVQQRFGYRLGRLGGLGRRNSYPLVQKYLPRSISHRGVAIGNAAHTLHPVAGQGFNLGLRDVAALAEVIVQARRRGDDIGALDVLEGYEAWRHRDQSVTRQFTDALVRGFSNDRALLKGARNLALVGLEVCPPARHALMHHAMGLSGRLPRLARGLRL